MSATSTMSSPTTGPAHRPAPCSSCGAPWEPSAILRSTFSARLEAPVTASGSGTPGRGLRTDDAPRRGIGRPIIAILAIGLIVRLIMAYAFPPLAGSGFKTDLDLFRYWADVLATHSPWGFYANAS